jgi:hypothetical protein
MKLLKYLAAGLLAVSFAASAHAQTKIYITGSTAFRSATSAAITAVLGVGPTDYTGTNANGANAQTWKVGSPTPTTIVKTSWTGSNAGVQTTAQAGTFYAVNFLPDNPTTPGQNQPDPRSGVNAHETAKPDIAMVDNAQSSSIFNGTVVDSNSHSETYAHLVDNIVGVIPFQWVASSGFPASQSMSYNSAQYLYSSAFGVPLAFWTGLNADEAKAVYGSGRDPDSGTRVVTFAESGIGVFSQVQQWKPTVSAGHITSLQLYPVQQINGFSTSVDGNSGESSGGTLAGYMGNVLDAGAYDVNGIGFTGGYLMVYVGVSDAATAITNGGVALKWNGVDYSATAVREGAYTFWGYEHMMWQSSLAGAKLTFGNNLKTQILTVDPTPNVKLSTMQVTRAKEGAPITATYF